MIQDREKLRDRSNILATQLLFLASPEFECHSLWTRFGSGDLNAATYKMSTERDEDFPSNRSRHPSKLARPAPIASTFDLSLAQCH